MFNTKHSAAMIRLKILRGLEVTAEERALYELVEKQIEAQKEINRLAGQ